MNEDRHAQSSGGTADPLYDVNIPTPTHAERARTLAAEISTGTLCTLALEPEGYPYGSFVTVAFDDGNPVFLISGLAEHTKNLERDHRAIRQDRGGPLEAGAGTQNLSPGAQSEPTSDRDDSPAAVRRV